jgi:hypothetical protein
MKTFGKATVMMAIFALTSAMSLTAQIVNGLTFKAPSAFYAGNTKFPAGSYKITQSSVEENTLLIESTDSKYAAYFDALPTQSTSPHAKTEVTFHKYGGTDYLNQVWIQGQASGLQVDPTKAEKKAAAAGSSGDHSVAASKL